MVSLSTLSIYINRQTLCILQFQFGIGIDKNSNHKAKSGVVVVE